MNKAKKGWKKKLMTLYQNRTTSWVNYNTMVKFIEKLLSDQLNEMEQDAKNHLDSSENKEFVKFWEDVLVWLSLFKKGRGE